MAKAYKQGEFDKAVYGVEEVAEILGVTRQTVCNYVKKGKIKSFETKGGHARFNREELIKYLDDKGLILEEEKRVETGVPIIYVRASSNNYMADGYVVKQIDSIKKALGDDFGNTRMIVDVGAANDGDRYGLKEIKHLAKDRKINKIFLYRKEELAGNFTDFVECFLNTYDVKLVSCDETEQVCVNK